MQEERSYEEHKYDIKFFLVEYGTMLAQYKGIEDLWDNQVFYEKFVSQACDWQIKLLKHSVHLSAKEKEELTELTLVAFKEVIRDFGKPFEEW